MVRAGGALRYTARVSFSRRASLGARLRRVLVVGALLLLGWAPPAAAAFEADAVYRVSDDGAPAHGAEDALVTIVEFSDYACSFCARARDLLDALALLYPGQLRLVHRSVPFLSESDLAATAARAAAAQGKHRAMEARLYAVRGQVDRAGVELLAQELGLDMLRFRAALDAGTHRGEVAADAQLAAALKVTSTPTFFINGRPVVGARPLAAFVEVIEAERARAVAAAQRSGLRGRALYRELVAAGRESGDDAPAARPARLELSPYATYRVGTGWPGLATGPASAPVTLVVFSDFECPYCAANQAALARVRATFGDSLRVVFRHFPLGFHRRAQLAAEAAMAAAAQGKFWSFHDHLLAQPGALGRAELEAAARAVGLDLVRFRAELEARSHRDAVLLDAAAGGALGVDGTPTMFVNGLAVPGVLPPERLEALIEAQLQAARALVAGGIEAGDVYAVIMSAASGAERGDPTTVPLPRATQRLQLPAGDRLRAAVASCRRRQAPSAALAALPEPELAIARAICAVYGDFSL